MIQLLGVFNLLVLFILSVGAPLLGAESEEVEKARLVVHLLDYLSVDYGGAVKSGKVVDANEFSEMKDFSNRLIELRQEVPAISQSAQLATDFEKLKKLVLEKAAEKTVFEQAQAIKQLVLKETSLVTAPIRYPSLKRGKLLFEKNCTQCHGAQGKGDGPLGASLDPKPSNFLDAERMSQFSPFQAYNAIRLGVNGTGMAAFVTLKEQEVWDLAFFVMSMRHQREGKSKRPDESLEFISNQNDQSLAQYFTSQGHSNAFDKVSEVRLYTEDDQPVNQFLSFAFQMFQKIPNDIDRKDYKAAKQKTLSGYLEGIEPIEPKLKATDPRLLYKMEASIQALRNSIEQTQDRVQVEKVLADVFSNIKEIEKALTVEHSPSLSFFVAAGVVLRESFEAILLLVTLFGVLKSFGLKREVFFVHLGWMISIAIGLALWFSSDLLFSFSGLNRELLEAVLSSVAVAIVFYMGIWLHQKSEIGKWKSFIQDKIDSAVSGKRLFTFFSISFVACFREVFETVLFLKAFLLESPEQDSTKVYLGLGTLTAFLTALVIAYFLIKLSRKVALKHLFRVSSLVMILLAFSLMGKSVHAFQETGLFSVNEFPLYIRLDLLGVFPTYETMAAQFFILCTAFMLWRRQSYAVSTAPKS